MKKLHFAVMLLSLVAPTAFAENRRADTQPKTEITAKEAEAIALKLVPGRVIEVEREKHKGEMVYTVEIKASDAFHEVTLLAANGKLISDKSKDTDDDDEEGESNE